MSETTNDNSSIENSDKSIQKPRKNTNPYDSDDPTHKLIKPFLDTVVHQMEVINSCWLVQKYLCLTEKDLANPDVDPSVKELPKALATTIYEGVVLRDELIKLVNAMQAVSAGVLNFTEIFNDEDCEDLPVTEYCDFIEEPLKDFKEVCETMKGMKQVNLEALDKRLNGYVKQSGIDAVKEHVKGRHDADKELQDLYGKWDELGRHEVEQIKSTGELLSTKEGLVCQLQNNEVGIEDLERQKKELEGSRKLYEERASKAPVTFLVWTREHGIYKEYENRKSKVNTELKALHETEDLKRHNQADLKEKLFAIEAKISAAQKELKQTQDDQQQIRDKIAEKKENYAKIDDKLIEICKKSASPSIAATILLLESIEPLKMGDSTTTNFITTTTAPMITFSKDLEINLKKVKKFDKKAALKFLKKIEDSMPAVRFFVREIQPAMRSNLQGENPDQLENFNRLKIAAS